MPPTIQRCALHSPTRESRWCRCVRASCNALRNTAFDVAEHLPQSFRRRQRSTGRAPRRRRGSRWPACRTPAAKPTVDAARAAPQGWPRQPSAPRLILGCHTPNPPGNVVGEEPGTIPGPGNIVGVSPCCPNGIGLGRSPARLPVRQPLPSSGRSSSSPTCPRGSCAIACGSASGQAAASARRHCRCGDSVLGAGKAK